MRCSAYPTRTLRIERFEDRRLLSATSPAELLLAIDNPSPHADDEFGAAIAAVGDMILVGAPRDDTIARDVGVAYLFDGATGELLHTLPQGPISAMEPKLNRSASFGFSVAAVGENALVGAPLVGYTDAPSLGAAYLFDATTGELLHGFENPEPDVGDKFGSVVLGIGDDVLVAAPFDSGDADGAGSVYLFDGETGALLHKFTDPTGAGPVAGGNFGGSMAVLDTDHILIASSPQETVFLFGRDGANGDWQLERTIENPEPNAREWFGNSLAVAGDQVFVGAVWDGTYGLKAGIGYQFDTSTDAWNWRRIPDPENLTHPTLADGDLFGESAAAAGDGFLVGASQAFVGEGVAYWFDSRTGAAVTLQNPAHGLNDQFGLRVAALGSDLIVGAPQDDTGAADTGRVYVFRLADTPVDTPPTVSGITDRTVYEDASTGVLAFTVSDRESAAESLAVTAWSSDPARIPDANLILGGSGETRTIEVVPAPDQNGGPVTISISVSDGTNTTVETFVVDITPVNDAPSFAIGPDQEVPEDCGPQSVAGFAFGMTAGPPDESGQILAFLVQTDNPDLFAEQPALDAATGRLTYTPAPDASGVAAVMVRLMDDGGIAGGGVDTSGALEFAIRVLSEQQQIDNLQDQIADLQESDVLNGGQAKSLSGKMEKVESSLDKGKTKVAANQLRAFINHVESLIEDGVLSLEEGEPLIGAAEDLLNSLLTESDGGPAAADAALAGFEPVRGPFGRK